MQGQAQRLVSGLTRQYFATAAATIPTVPLFVVYEVLDITGILQSNNTKFAST
jgi:hypothetical protein